VAAIYPPWWTAARIVGAAAGTGDIAAAGGLPNILVLQGDAELAARARRSGALLVLGGNAVRLCADIPSQEA